MQAAEIRAFVTGGVSGLGLAVAQRIVADGGRVVIADVAADRAAAALAELGDAATFIELNVADESAAKLAIDRAKQAMGGLNLAVNCAGILGAGRVLGREGPMPLDQFAKTVTVNLIGSFNIAKAAAAAMADNVPGEDGERGLIVNTASIAAYEGQIGQAAYSASKGGVVGMTLPMAREFARIGVRVVTIAPGVFHTPMVDGMPAEVYESLCAQVPYPSRLGTPDEYAQTVAFVAANRYINGTTIRIDGAIRLAPK